MDKTVYVYSFTELLSLVDGFIDFIEEWNNTAPNLRTPGELIEARYGDWTCMYCDEGLTDTEIKAKAYTLYTSMTAWIKQYAPHYNELAGIEVTNASKSTAKFNDTPETAGDYSSLEHTSTISMTENESSSFGEKWEKARYDCTTAAINQFRKQFLTKEDY